MYQFAYQYDIHTIHICIQKHTHNDEFTEFVQMFVKEDDRTLHCMAGCVGVSFPLRAVSDVWFVQLIQALQSGHGRRMRVLDLCRQWGGVLGPDEHVLLWSFMFFWWSSTTTHQRATKLASRWKCCWHHSPLRWSPFRLPISGGVMEASKPFKPCNLEVRNGPTSGGSHIFVPWRSRETHVQWRFPDQRHCSPGLTTQNPHHHPRRYHTITYTCQDCEHTTHIKSA